MKLKINNMQKINKIYIIIIFNFISILLFGQNLPDLSFEQRGLIEGLEKLDLKTGDLAMFQSKTFNGVMTQIGTLSPYTHCALILKNQDGSLYLLHATENDYEGYRIPIIGEKGGRPGVILTRLEDMFLSVDNYKSGFYKHIRIIRFDDKKFTRPKIDSLFSLYEKYKNCKFPLDKMTFIYSSFDLNIFGKDLISKKSENSYICSGLVAELLFQTHVLEKIDKNRNEYTPMNIRRMEPYLDAEPIIFKFRDGKYRINK
jgi:hypothetical protein